MYNQEEISSFKVFKLKENKNDAVKENNCKTNISIAVTQGYL